MGLTWHIREASTEDADGLKNCMEAAYTAYQDRMGGVRLPPMDVDYLSEINNYPTWIVEAEGKILGGLIMSFENNQASIANIAVDPKCQGQGIGGALMKLAESKARENNFSELHLTTHVLLHENVSLYRHLDWEETSRNEAKVFMKKDI
ncbi:MAG TPA: GNAT family N-acetyltransferase [Nitrospinota bacterium]|nr:GNAT family N-acetyltransferase [Nitrospinota bacterium]